MQNRGQRNEGRNGSRKDRQNDRPYRDDFSDVANGNTLSMSVPQILRSIQNRLPAHSFESFKMGNETLTPTKNQRLLMSLMDKKDVLLITGPAGTGKTLWACFMALRGLADGKYNRFCLTAPAVEADENLGFRKGDKNEKMESSVNQLLETIDDLVGKSIRLAMMETGILEIAPHADNRGRTYKDSVYLLDELQNASARQLQTAISRLGNGSTFVFMGDDIQNDRTDGTSAFVAFVKRFTSDPDYAEEIGEVRMTADDVRRHPLLQKIIRKNDHRPLEGFEDRRDSRINKAQSGPAPFPALRQ